MSGAMIKTTIREIKGSFGRYLAILSIVMLGVGFFAGLKVTKPAMIATEQDYLSAQSFYDFKLLSTIGFTEEDVAELAEMEEIEDAEGAISVDALCSIEDENDAVYKIMAVPETINRIVLTAGRMPNQADECVLDANKYEESHIGSQVEITKNNDEDTLDMFHNRTFTVVGIAQSPCYINFERGTASIGEGKIEAFVYVPKDSFACDYLTEIYLTTAQKYDVYSDAYEDYIDYLQDGMEDKTKELSQARYRKLIDDAQDKIDDAQAELDEKKEEAEEELNQAAQEIADAEQEILDGEKKIVDSEQSIADHEKEITGGRAEIRKAKDTLSAQEEELNVQEAQLAAMAAMLPPMQYQGGMRQIQAGREQIEAARVEIAAKEAELAKGDEDLQEAKEEIETAKADLEEAREKLAEAKEEYEDAVTEFEEETAKAQQKIDDAEAELADIEEPDEYVLTRNSNIGYACFDSDSSIVAAISNVFPAFFFLVAALICMTTMNRMVEEQRTQIGVLKALGYGNGAIMGKFLFYAGSAAVIGAIVGCIGGTWLFPKVIWEGYGIMYNMGAIEYVFDGWLAAFSIAAALLCSMGAAYLSCRYELYSAPANLIRPKAPKNGKRVFLENVTFIWNRMKFLHKVSVRNVVRYKKRFFMMILGIGGCTALLLTGFGIKDSVVDIADLQFNEIQIFDIGIRFKDALTDEEMDAVTTQTQEMLADIAYRYEETVDMDFGGKTKSLYLEIPRSVEEISTFLNMHTQSGETIAYPASGEAVLTAKTAENMGIRVGDRVVLRDSGMNRITVTITALCENFVYNYIYINQETYEDQIGGKPEFRSAYAIVKEGTDIHEAAAAIADKKNVLSVSVTRDMRDRIANMMKSMDYIVLLIIACAGSLAFIVLYNLTNINITERIREIATIKVLGFYAKETADYVFRENLVLTGIGAALGLLLGKWLHWFVMYHINIDMISFRTHIAQISYLWSILFTFAFAAFVDGLMYFKLEKINMAESLKSIE